MATAKSIWIDNDGNPHDSKFEAELADITIALSLAIHDPCSGVVASLESGEGWTEIGHDDVKDFILSNATVLHKVLGDYLELTKDLPQ